MRRLAVVAAALVALAPGAALGMEPEGDDAWPCRGADTDPGYKVYCDQLEQPPGYMAEYEGSAWDGISGGGGGGDATELDALEYAAGYTVGFRDGIRGEWGKNLDPTKVKTDWGLGYWQGYYKACKMSPLCA